MAARDLHCRGLAGVFFAGNVVTQMLIVHQVVHLVDHGMSVLAAAMVSGVVGLVSIAGKVEWGALLDRTGREPAYTLAFACVVANIGTLPLAGRYPASNLLYLYAVLIGVGYAASAPLMPATPSDLFGGPGFSTIFGTLHTVLSVGGAFGAWAADQTFDITGSYTTALWAGLAMVIVSPGVLRVVARRRPNPLPAAERPRG